MDDFERYTFDLHGFIVVEQACPPEDVAELNSLLDEYDLWNAERDHERFAEQWTYDDNFRIVGPAHRWDEAFRRAIANPRLRPYLAEVLGPDYRYDHGHLLLMRKGGGKLRLHGGGTPYEPDHGYVFRNGRIYCGLVAVSLALVDMSAEEGGFVCLPGSHKSNLPCPQTFITLETTGRWVQRVSLKAGDAVIFSEALTHGTYPWTGDHERRTYLMKYAPGTVATQDTYPVPEDFHEADGDPVVDRLFRRPFSVVHDPVTHEDIAREPVPLA